MDAAKKKLLVDLSKLQGAYCGLWEVSRRFGQALIECIDHNRWDVTFLVPNNHPFTDSRVRYLPLGWWSRFFLGFRRYDVLHGLVQNTPYLRRKKRHSRYVITLHDLNFLYEEQGVRRRSRLQKTQDNLLGVNHLVFISQFVERDAQEHLNLNGITHSVIYNGVADRKSGEAPQMPDGLSSLLRERPFLFFVSTFMRKKNIHLVVEMMKYLPDLCLVIAGRIIHQDYYKEVCKIIEKEGLGDRVVYIGPVVDAEKYWLFDSCEAFVFPSQAEGFGIPPIESMRAGKTVFASRCTSVPEVCGDMAFYWDTLEPEVMADVVKWGLADKSAPQNNAELLRDYAQKYSWRTCSGKYINVYESLVGERKF